MSRPGRSRDRQRRMERAREVVARNDPWDLLAALAERVGVKHGSLIATYCDGKLVDTHWFKNEFKLRGTPVIEKALVEVGDPQALQ
jgi:hypothetical protein